MNPEKVEGSLWTDAEHRLPLGSDRRRPSCDARIAPPLKAIPRLEDVGDPRSADVLLRHQFLIQLEREKRRTDRSKTPLSIALFRLDGEKSKKLDVAEQLLEILRDSKRQTDILGYLGEESLALLLPDTSAEGVQGYLKKIPYLARELPLSITTGTYPDELFDSLVKEDRVSSDSSPLYLDDYRKCAEGGYALKRILDIAGSLCGILLLAPVMIITAIAIAMTSPGPVIFKQIRVGKQGRPFVFYKFRSMYANADDRIHREFVTKLIEGHLDEVNQGDADNPHYKIKSDPRVTRVGAFIRDKCIDEIPQLVNVLKGDMSLVGPRPPLPYEVENYESWHLRRILEIRPGITGLWQVEGHSSTTFDDMVRLDLRYIKGCSLKLDLGILLKTLKRFLG